MRPRAERDAYFLRMLELVASRGTCARRKVAAIIVDARDHILATGYNGVPRGFPHCIESPCPGRDDPPGDSRRCEAVHAEQNALLQCRDLERAATIYASCSPCFTCAKLIANTNITRVVCLEPYTDSAGWDVLFRAGKELQYR